MTGRRRPLTPGRSLKRNTKPREPEPILPENYATAEKPIGMCRNCHHHTSAFAAGCTALVWPEGGLPIYCGCWCNKYLGDPRKD